MEGSWLRHSFPGTEQGQPRPPARPPAPQAESLGDKSSPTGLMCGPRLSKVPRSRAGLQAPPCPRPLQPVKALGPPHSVQIHRQLLLGLGACILITADDKKAPAVKSPGTLHGAETEGSLGWSGHLQVSPNCWGSWCGVGVGQRRAPQIQDTTRPETTGPLTPALLSADPWDRGGDSDSLARGVPEAVHHLQALPGEAQAADGDSL